MMPKMPKITNTIEIPSKTPHKLRLNFRLCSRFKLFWADHKEYELVVWWPLRWLPSGGYFLEDVEWTDLFDLMEDAVVNACLGTVPPGWGTLAPPCAKLRREANDMASSRSLSSKASFLWKKKKNNNKSISQKISNLYSYFENGKKNQPTISLSSQNKNVVLKIWLSSGR